MQLRLVGERRLGLEWTASNLAGHELQATRKRTFARQASVRPDEVMICHSERPRACNIAARDSKLCTRCCDQLPAAPAQGACEQVEDPVVRLPVTGSWGQPAAWLGVFATRQG